MNKKESPYVVAEEVALKEVQEFVEYHLDKPMKEDKIESEYPNLIGAIMRGILNITNPDAPVYKLRESIKDEKGGVAVAEITFKTRINSSTYKDLGKGIDFKNDTLKFANIITAHLCGFDAVGYLDKFPNKHDYKVVQQLTSLFT